MRIVERNYRIRQGEIDIIGYHNGYLVFIEVKYRKENSKGSPEEAVSHAKQRTICRVADHYRHIRKLPESTPIRYDVLAIREIVRRNENISDGKKDNLPGVIWYQNAFPHIYVNSL